MDEVVRKVTEMRVSPEQAAQIEADMAAWRKIAESASEGFAGLLATMEEAGSALAKGMLHQAEGADRG